MGKKGKRSKQKATRKEADKSEFWKIFYLLDIELIRFDSENTNFLL